MSLIRGMGRGMSGDQRRSNFCTRVEVVMLTPPLGSVVCGE